MEYFYLHSIQGIFLGQVNIVCRHALEIKDFLD